MNVGTRFHSNPSTVVTQNHNLNLMVVLDKMSGDQPFPIIHPDLPVWVTCPQAHAKITLMTSSGVTPSDLSKCPSDIIKGVSQAELYSL